MTRTGTIYVTVRGFDHDKRDLWQIPEVRTFLRELWEQCRLLGVTENLSRIAEETVGLFTAAGARTGYKVDVRPDVSPFSTGALAARGKPMRGRHEQ